MPGPKQPEEPRDWLQYAVADLLAAQGLLALGPQVIRQALLHAQQAAEKALKAFLIGRDRPYPLTHDINRLRMLCSAVDATLEPYAVECLALSPFAGVIRYPGTTRLPEMDLAQELVAAAEALVAAVSERLGIAGP